MSRRPYAILIAAVSLVSLVPLLAARADAAPRVRPRPLVPLWMDARPSAVPASPQPPPELFGWTKDGVLLAISGTPTADVSAVSDGAGGVIAAYLGIGAGGLDLFATRLDANGDFVAGWSTGGTPVVTSAASEVGPECTSDEAGGVIVAFTTIASGFPSGLFFQRLTGAGTRSTGWPADGVSSGAGSPLVWKVTPDGNHGAYAGWADLNSSDLMLTRVTSAGAIAGSWPAGGIRMTTLPNPEDFQLSGDGAGGVYVAWARGDSIFLQRLTATGAVASGWPADGFVVEGEPTFFRQEVALTTLTSGDAMVVWSDTPTSDSDIYSMRVASTGALASGWPVAGVPLCTAAGTQMLPQLVSDGAGGAVAMWEDMRGGATVALYAQRVTGTGAIQSGWTTDGVALCSGTDTKTDPSWASDGAGGGLVAWDDARNGNDDVFAQRITSAGAIASGWPADGAALVTASGDQNIPTAVTGSGGGVIVVWDDGRNVNIPRVYAGFVDGSGVVPALAALADASSAPGLVRLHWFSPDGENFAATLERAVGAGAFSAIAGLRADGTGHVRYEDRDVVAGATYHYRLAVTESGATRYLGEVTLTVPSGVALAVEGFRPNPATGPVSVAFALGSGARASLEVLDVSGRRVLSREVGSLGAGRHVLRLDEAGALPAGVYVVRLSQDGRVLAARAAIVR